MTSRSVVGTASRFPAATASSTLPAPGTRTRLARLTIAAVDAPFGAAAPTCRRVARPAVSRLGSVSATDALFAAPINAVIGGPWLGHETASDFLAVTATTTGLRATVGY